MTARILGSRRRLWLALAGAAAILVTVLAVSLGGKDPDPPPHVEPVQAGSSPAEEARNLSAWLRENAAAGS